MRSGITRHALRRHRWTLLGPACTQAIGAGVIAMMVMTTMAINNSLTAAQRGTAGVVELADTSTVFLGVSVYLSILIVGVTMNLAMAGQLRDIALLRAIGASPGQVRRSVVLQAVLVAVPSSTLGFLAAIPVGAVWVAALQAHGVAPDALRFAPQWLALPIALGVGLATSVVGTWVAARRVSRVAPAVALSETSTGQRVRPARSVVGLVLIVAGVVLSAVLSQFVPEQAADAAFFVMLAECIGVGMLGPWLLRTVAGLLRPVVPPGIGQLALDDLTAMTRTLSGALVPLVLAAAFALVKVATHTTAAHVTGILDPATDRWTDYSGTAIYCVFAGVAALNCFVTVLIGRDRDLAAMQLAGGTRRAIVCMVAIESAIVTATALVLAAGVAGATLLPMLYTNFGTWLPHVPLAVLAVGVVLTAGIVAAGMVGPAAVLTERQPIEVVRISG
jgi:putative ABC transport system permease protein